MPIIRLFVPPKKPSKAKPIGGLPLHQAMLRAVGGLVWLVNMPLVNLFNVVAVWVRANVFVERHKLPQKGYQISVGKALTRKPLLFELSFRPSLPILYHRFLGQVKPVGGDWRELAEQESNLWLVARFFCSGANFLMVRTAEFWSGGFFFLGLALSQLWLWSFLKK